MHQHLLYAAATTHSAQFCSHPQTCPSAMLHRPIAAATSAHLYRSIHHISSSLRCGAAAHTQLHPRRHSSTTRHMSAAAASAAEAASSIEGTTTTTSSSSTSQVVIYDKEALQRPIRGVVFDMDGTLTVPVIDFQYMRQVRRGESVSE